jgi:hypothetical protein
VQEHLGSDADAQFRLWYIDNALHGDEDLQEFPGRSVSYLGALETALLQLTDWVEKGIEPSPTSTYDIVDGQVAIPVAASKRRGVQPVVSVTANGSSRAEVRVGQPTSLRIEAEAVEGLVIELVEVFTDAEGTEKIGETFDFEPTSQITHTIQRVFDEAGTYFFAVRVTAQTRGDAASPHAQVQNIGRVRICVTA